MRRPPPLYRTGPHGAAACYLYREGVVVRGEDMGAVLVGGTSAAGGAERAQIWG